MRDKKCWALVVLGLLGTLLAAACTSGAGRQSLHGCYSLVYGDWTGSTDLATDEMGGLPTLIGLTEEKAMDGPNGDEFEVVVLEPRTSLYGDHEAHWRFAEGVVSVMIAKETASIYIGMEGFLSDDDEGRVRLYMDFSGVEARAPFDAIRRECPSPLN